MNTEGPTTPGGQVPTTGSTTVGVSGEGGTPTSRGV